ncbi:hypothetical protein [Parasphingorhabdus sp.]|uniref:hypothetical protein n=1 Tax=Parasphingorhabdus sp. TaxID=2709688 RepID=UPI003A9132EA
MTYPYDRNEVEVFVPKSLQSLENPPTFHLRPGTSREKRHFTRLALEEGLTNHSNDAMRSEMLRGLKEFCTEAEYSDWEPRIKALWEAGDEFDMEHKDTPFDQAPEFKHHDQEAIETVLKAVKRDWRQLRVMGAENIMFSQMLPTLTNSLVIMKCENVDVPIQKNGKYLSLDCAEAISDWLEQFGTDQNVEGSPARELEIACLLKMNFTKAQEKNSASPSPSTNDQQNLKVGEESTDGKSKASASSEKIQKD